MATYFAGFTIECDTSQKPYLRIEGIGVAIEKSGSLWLSPDNPAIKKETLNDLARSVIENSATYSSMYEKRIQTKKSHLKVLKEGKDFWNKWRKDNPNVRPLLYDITTTPFRVLPGLGEPN